MTDALSRDQIERMVRAILEKSEIAPVEAPGIESVKPTPVPSPAPAGSARAVVLTARETLQPRRFPIPKIGPGEILVKVEACGICGTDIHCYRHDPFQLCPVVLGHEGTGEVVEVGGGVGMDSVGKPVRPGDKIVTSILETSSACQIAKYNPLKANLCDDLRIYGLLPDEPDHHFNGYFAEYLVIRPGSSFFVVNDLSEDLRVLIEPAAVVCHALERAKNCGSVLNFRSRVIVQGCGPIGLMMIAVLKTHGINNIIAIDGNASRLEWARRLGADHLINFKDHNGAAGVAGAVGEITKGIGAHFGFQCTGIPQAAANLVRYIRRGGGICELGHFVDGGQAAFNPHEDFCKKEITLIGSWAYNSWEYPNAYHFLDRAEKIGLPVAQLITHRFSLDAIQQAFETVLRQEGIKVVVRP